ncbi:hypothetical protein D9M70_545280 [compost metagenome]
MSLSFRITSRLMLGVTPALFMASNAMPADMAPSPMMAMCWRCTPALRDATAMPSAAEMEVDECAVPKASYSDSLRFGKPEMPPCCRSWAMPARRPVRILWG